MDDETLYQIAVETRRFEIQLFWQRSGYFMALNTAIAIGFFALEEYAYAPILAFLGATVSFLWFLVNLGSKYWQSRWEHAASRLEMKCAPEAELFSASPEQVQQAVRESLEVNRHTGFQAWIDKKILKKPSVSYRMTVLSFFFMLFWVAVIVAFLFLA